MESFYLTFGQKYRREPHPVDAAIHPDGFVHVRATDYADAREQAFDALGQQWGFIYPEVEWVAGKHQERHYPLGQIGVIRRSEFIITPLGEDVP